MIRPAVIIALFLAAGVVVNLVTAWVCAGRAVSSHQPMPLARVQDVWDRYRPADWADDAVSSGSNLTFGRRVLLAGGYDDERMFRLIQEVHCGWPEPAIAFAVITDGPANRAHFRRAWRIPLDIRTVMYGSTGNYLGRGILWPGFVINSLLAAGALWLLLAGPGTARRMWRWRTGRCLLCGYDLRGDPAGGCPECGWRRNRR